jgi:hypothetical protein
VHQQAVHLSVVSHKNLTNGKAGIRREDCVICRVLRKSPDLAEYDEGVGLYGKTKPLLDEALRHAASANRQAAEANTANSPLPFPCY